MSKKQTYEVVVETISLDTFHVKANSKEEAEANVYAGNCVFSKSKSDEVISKYTRLLVKMIRGGK